MKKNIFKLIICILCFAMFFSFSVVNADGAVDNEELVIKNLSNTILNIFMYFGYAIAIGAIIFMGIKYMISSANERANLKGLFPKLLIGIFLITFCFSIAKFVAGLAGDNNNAEDIIGVGENAGNQFVGGGGSSGIIDENVNINESEEWVEDTYKGGNIIVNVPKGVTYSYEDGAGYPTVIAPLMYNNQKFSHWKVIETPMNGGKPIEFNHEDSTFVAKEAEGHLWFNDWGVNAKYELTIVFED